VIDMDRLGARRALAEHVFAAVGADASRRLGKPARFWLARELDEPTLARMLELEAEIFTVENNVYQRQDIIDCVASEDAFLLLFAVEGRIEGYVFGYEEDAEYTAVEDTEYFVDTAVVSLAHQRLGVGRSAAILVFLVLYLAGYRRIGVTTQLRDKTGRELVRFYRELGFEDARHLDPEHYQDPLTRAMRIVLDARMLQPWLERLGSDADQLTKDDAG